MLLHLPQAAPVTLTLDLTKPGVAVSPTLYGLMTEEINYSYDGGLYGELVRNRAYQNDPQRPASWSPVGEGATINLEHTGGPTAALTAFLRVKGGVANEGYWGIPVRPSTAYRLSFWAKVDAPGSIAASLESNDGATVYARTDVTGVDGTWRKLTTTLTTANVPPTKEARLVLRTGDRRTTSLALVSLFPPTYNARPNGVRPDLMQLLVDMRPRFLRFPGGNYLEGNTFAERFNWKETLGPLEDRPGHRSPWGYHSTDGMGLLEFLNWCEDMNAKPVLALFAGYVLRGDVIKPGTELGGFVQDALDEIEYVTGDARTTKWGRQRAQDGHPAPFDIAAVEIGNEDGVDESGSYEARFLQFHKAIKNRYPKIPVISTTGGKDWLGLRYPITNVVPDLVDEHYYASTWEMMAMASKYDAYDRKGPKVIVGEWAAQDVPAPWADADKKGPTPNMNCALADAAFMTGMERNSDVVRMSCYAPLLVNVNPGGRQWAVNLIGYDALRSFGSPSYYAQRMFGQNLGNRTVPISMADVPTQTQGAQTIPALFASATRDTKTGTLYVKLVNPLPTAQEVAFDLKGGTVTPDGSVSVLSGDPEAVNTLAEPTKVAPATSTVHDLSGSFRRTLEPYSVTVLTLSIR